MFQTISAINIGQGPGKAFGGGIYNASVNIGFSNNPTKISLGVVSEDGQFNPVSPQVNASPYEIDINGKTFSGMYLFSYEKTKASDSSLMTLNFADSSIVLDKIYVGLLNRHGNQYRRSTLVSGLFNVRCVSCVSLATVTGITGYARRYVDDISVNNGSYFEKSPDGGGYIILGKEYFPDSNCEIPKVDYNFTELCSALDAFGLPHELGSFDVNPLYRQEYAGSLREVLNNWGGDMGFEFYFDGNTLKGIDLRQPISLTSVQSFADTNEYVNSTSYGESLENTYTQTVVARYLKPSRVRDYNTNYFIKNAAQPLSLGDILAGGTCAGRSDDVLLTSVALSRLDNSLRECYIANQAAERNNNFIMQALGFSGGASYRLDENVYADRMEKDTILFSTQFIKNVLADVSGITAYSVMSNPNNWDVFVGLYDEEMKSRVEAWDREATNFVGKYYTFVNSLPNNVFECPFAADWYVYYTFDSTWTTLPNSEIHGGRAFPFENILIDPVSNTTLSNYSAVRNLFSVDDNTWGIEQEVFNADKGSGNYDFLRPKMILADEIIIGTEKFLNLLAHRGGTVTAAHSGILGTAKSENTPPVAYCIAPRLSKMKAAGANVPIISPVLYRTFNNAVYDRLINRGSNDTSSVTCKTYCDRDIVSEICDCGTTYTPVPYFINLMAPFVHVIHPNGIISKVVFPVDSNYWGYFHNRRYFKTTYGAIKSIYGKPPIDGGNTMSTRVVDYDMTPDLDAIVDHNNAVGEFIYLPDSQQIVTSQSYYNSLVSLNNITIPPQKTIRINIARSDLTSLGIPLSPAEGLTNMSISISDGGYTTELTYSSRPPFVPKRDVIFPKVKYRLVNNKK